MASRIACVAGGIRERVSGGGTVIFSRGRSPPFAKPAREFASGEANSIPRQFTHGFATRAHGFATKTKALTTKTKALTRQIGCARVYKKVDEKAGAWDRNYLGRMKNLVPSHFAWVVTQWFTWKKRCVTAHLLEEHNGLHYPPRIKSHFKITWRAQGASVTFDRKPESSKDIYRN